MSTCRKKADRGNIVNNSGVVLLGRAAERVYEELRRRIESGNYQSGQRLPPERELCKLLDVSRLTLRQALGRLELEKLIHSIQGSGTFVNKTPEIESRVNTISLMNIFSDTYLTEIQDYVLSKGYLLSIYSQLRTQWDLAAERQFLHQVKEQRHKGLLAFCSSSEPGNNDMLQALEYSGVRVLHIEHYRVEPPEQGYLLPDFRRAAHMAAIKLMMAGYDSLYLVSRHEMSAPFQQLELKGFTEALAEHGFPFSPDIHILDNPYSIPGADYAELLRGLARKVPKGAGVVVQTTTLAERLVFSLKEIGIKVPEEVGVIGIDDAVGTSEGVDGTADNMSFMRSEQLKRAIDEIIRPEWRGIKELILPKYVRNGSVR